MILRPHNIYGPRMGYSHGVIPEQIYKIKNKKIFDLFTKSQKEHFVTLMMLLIKLCIFVRQKKISIKYLILVTQRTYY